MGSIAISISTYDGTSTLGNGIDDEIRHVLNGEGACFNVES